MTGTFTCNPCLDSVTCSIQHRKQTALSCSSIYMQTSPYSDIVSKPGSTVVATSDGTSTPTTPCFSLVSDTKAVCTSVEVSDMAMQDGISPGMSENVPGSPSSVVTANNQDDHQQLPDLTHESSPSVKARQTASSHGETHRPSKRKSTRSRASSTSRRGPRSASRSTAGRSDTASRRSSLHLQSPSNPRRTSNGVMSRERREELLSLHRDCCRLFQESGFALGDPQLRGISETTSLRDFRVRPADDTRPPRFSSDNFMHTSRISTSRAARMNMQPVSEPSTPILPQFPVSANFPPYSPSVASDRAVDRDGSDTGSVCGNEAHGASNALSDVEPPYQPVTVIDWTSPSTRRREYEKIDRSSRGIRGLWRRFAPKWCQPGQGRVPFFEEGKGGKGNYEGSVRRFRMDLPDEEEDEHDRRRVDLGGDGNKDFAISGSRLRNASSKLSGSTYDRGRTKWRCLKLKRRSRSTW